MKFRTAARFQTLLSWSPRAPEGAQQNECGSAWWQEGPGVRCEGRRDIRTCCVHRRLPAQRIEIVADPEPMALRPCAYFCISRITPPCKCPRNSFFIGIGRPTLPFIIRGREALFQRNSSVQRPFKSSVSSGSLKLFWKLSVLTSLPSVAPPARPLGEASTGWAGRSTGISCQISSQPRLFTCSKLGFTYSISSSSPISRSL